MLSFEFNSVRVAFKFDLGRRALPACLEDEANTHTAPL